MDKIIACCGIVCSNCDAYIATKNNDNELRKKTAENWSKMFNGNFTPEDINCLGCHSDTLMGYCNTCEIRKCNTEKSNANCSQCSDYACEKIQEFFKMVPEAKNVLDSLK